jgi:hypothetical protein
MASVVLIGTKGSLVTRKGSPVTRKPCGNPGLHRIANKIRDTFKSRMSDIMELDRIIRICLE